MLTDNQIKFLAEAYIHRGKVYVERLKQNIARFEVSSDDWERRRVVDYKRTIDRKLARDIPEEVFTAMISDFCNLIANDTTREYPSDISSNGLTDEKIERWRETKSAEVFGEDCLVYCTTHPVILRGINFNTFEIRVNIKSFLTGVEDSWWFAVVPNNPIDYNNPHPHMAGSSLCFGEVGNTADSCLRDGNFLWVMHNVNNIMHTYNPGSPHKRIESYSLTNVREPCADCATVQSRSALCRCPGCSKRFCSNCDLRRCTRCSNYVCYSCIGKSPIEDQIICARCGPRIMQGRGEISIGGTRRRFFMPSAIERGLYATDKKAFRETLRGKVLMNRATSGSKIVPGLTMEEFGALPKLR